MLKSLFIPSDDFFTNWLDDLNSYFGDTFGILYYPFEILIDFLNRISQISDSETAIIHVPAFVLDFFGNKVTVLPAIDYDFNSLLTNDTFKNIHNVYLIFVDIILWLGLVYLAQKCLKTIIGGITDETIPDYEDTDEYKDAQAYRNYTRTRKFAVNDRSNIKRNM